MKKNTLTTAQIGCGAFAASQDLPIIEAAAAKGKHIFCEKPLAMKDEHAFKIISAVRRGKSLPIPVDKIHPGIV